LPLRTNRTHRGAAPLTVRFVLTPPWLTRDWNSNPLPGLAPAIALGAPAVRSARIITPPLVHPFTFCRLSTRATISPSPSIV
jgi:hypothetical protein